MFTFEHTHKLSQAEYVGIWSLLNRSRPSAYARRIGIVVGAVACLFSPYTFLLGVVLLALASVMLFIPHLIPGTAARVFRELRYLNGPVSYGVNEDSVWVRTSDFLAKVSWYHVTVWRERECRLVLQGSGFPPVLLPIAGLRAGGAYERVKEMAERHAQEYGRPKTQPATGRANCQPR
jgi:hypothetical protein